MTTKQVSDEGFHHAVGVQPRYWNYQPTPSDPWWGGAVERGKDKTEDGGWKEWRGAWGEKKGGWDLEWLIISRYYYRMHVVGLAVYFRQNRGKVDARPINVPRKKEQILSYSREKDKWLKRKGCNKI